MSNHPFAVGDLARRVGEPRDAHRCNFPYKLGDICRVDNVRPNPDMPNEQQIFVMGRWSGAMWWSLAERPEAGKKPTVEPDLPRPPSLVRIGVEKLIKEISYKPGWSVEVHEEDGFRDHALRYHHGRVYLQLSVSAFAEASMDSVKRDGTRTPWKSAKRYLSPHMCRQELVGVVFGLIKDAELHEVHEWFRYKGASIFNPHLDPDVLAEVARKKSSFNVRENAMTMEESAA